MNRNTGLPETPSALTLSASVPSVDRRPIAHALRVSDVTAARGRLRGVIRETPCTREPGLTAETGMQVYLKREYLQATGSFKERGAANALACLEAADRRRGVIAASAGNHALGLARHGARLGVPVTLVMPCGAARVKIERCRKLGATVELAGADFSDAECRARVMADAGGLRFVHPFDDPYVMAGQGTIGLEVFEQVPDLEAIVVPVCGANVDAVTFARALNVGLSHREELVAGNCRRTA